MLPDGAGEGSCARNRCHASNGNNARTSADSPIMSRPVPFLNLVVIVRLRPLRDTRASCGSCKVRRVRTDTSSSYSKRTTYLSRIF